MHKYNPGDKFIIEIEDVIYPVKDGLIQAQQPMYKVKGFDSMIMTDYALDKLRSMLTEAVKDEGDDKIGLEIGDVVNIDGELFYYNGHYDYVYSEIGYNYCFVRNKSNINTDEERKVLDKLNYDVVIDSRDLEEKDGQFTTYEPVSDIATLLTK